MYRAHSELIYIYYDKYTLMTLPGPEADMLITFRFWEQVYSYIKPTTEAGANVYIHHFERQDIDEDTMYLGVRLDVCFDSLNEALNFKIRHGQFLLKDS